MPVFRTMKIPKRLEDAGIGLELNNLWNWPLSYRLLKEADRTCLERLGLDPEIPPFRIFLCSLYLFSWVYIIKKENEPVGLLGVYQWEPGIQLFLTLALVKEISRHRGIGSKAIEILMGSIEERRICRQVLVEVKKDNHSGLGFWEKNNFRLCHETGSTYLLMRKVLEK